MIPNKESLDDVNQNLIIFFTTSSPPKTYRPFPFHPNFAVIM